MAYWAPLSEITLADRARYGGKAAHLGEALRLGCPVLPGVALSTALYQHFMRQGGLQGEIASILNIMQPTTMIQCQAAEWAIRTAFEVRQVPDLVLQAITEAWHAMGDRPLAVRSSATNEDSPQQSFVGQHATVLDVASAEEAVQAVLTCWQSLFSAKAIIYAQRFGLDLQSSAMGILFQPMVKPSAQGALFTVDPVTGNADRFLLEIQQGPDAGLHVLDPYHRKPGERPFWSQLRELGLLLDEQREMYYALEWLIVDEQLRIIRVRPVTGAPPYLPDAQVETIAGRGPLYLVRDPDLHPRAVRPHSWYQRSRTEPLRVAQERYTHRPGSQNGGRTDHYLCGYLYRRHAPSPPDGADIGAALRAWPERVQRLYTARRLDQPFRALWREKRPRLEAMSQDDLTALPPVALANMLREAMALHEAFWAEHDRLTENAQGLKRLICDLGRLWLGQDLFCEPLVAVFEDAVTQAREQLCDLARSQADAEACARYELLHRHRFLKGDPLAEWVDLASLEEAPGDMEAQRDAWRVAHKSLREENAARRQEREALERDLLARLRSWQRPIFRHTLRMARRYQRDALDCSDAVCLCRLLEHDLVWEVGRRLCSQGLAQQPSDAALLGAPELLDWLVAPSRRDEIVRLMMQRNETQRRWRRYTPPMVLGEGEATPLSIPEEAERYVGVPISAGVARGKARLVEREADAAAVLPGEILVCREALFEYAPLFGVVSAVVAEGGQLLDHASVLAREYGVPAVFGVKNAMRFLKTGDDLVVVASEGLVYRPVAEPTWEMW